MGRKKEFEDVFSARFRAGTADAIEAALAPGETPADFIRVAVAAELDRRRRKERRQAKATAADVVEVPIRAVPPESVDWCARIPASKSE